MNDVLSASGGVKQVICINWGTKYGAKFINRLYGMVARNITPPFTFTCFTDTRDGLNPNILCEDLPPLAVSAMPVNTPGIWNKARLWGPKLGSLKGPVLFLDLDLVIVRSLDAFFEVGSAEDVVMTRNQTTPFEKLGQTSLYRFPVGKLLPLQEAFCANPQGIADQYRFEQRFVTRRAPGGVTFWPKGWVVHFRADCVPAFPARYWRAPRIPAGAKIVIFAGSLNPPDAILGRWSEKDTPRDPADHLRAALDGRRRESLPRHLRHYIRPAEWVGRLWRE